MPAVLQALVRVSDSALASLQMSWCSLDDLTDGFQAVAGDVGTLDLQVDAGLSQCKGTFEGAEGVSEPHSPFFDREVHSFLMN
jgi:hypothetical protein